MILPANHRLWRLVMLLAFIMSRRSARAMDGDPLVRQVTIYRDEYGVPHIVGATEEATFFGYGYAQAEDHLERMMIQYRDAQGHRASVPAWIDWITAEDVEALERSQYFRFYSIHDALSKMQEKTGLGKSRSHPRAHPKDRPPK